MRFRFSDREIRAIALLLPTVVLSTWLGIHLVRHNIPSTEEILYKHTTNNNTYITDTVRSSTKDIKNFEIKIFDFDPNTISYEELRKLGIDKHTAVNIIKYRTAGKIFRIKEEFAECYGITDSIYAALKDHIIISPEYAIWKRDDYNNISAGISKISTNGNNPLIDTVNTPDIQKSTNQEIATEQGSTLFFFNPDTASIETFLKLGFTEKQAQTIINYRTSCGGFRDADHFGQCRAVTKEMFGRLRPYIKIKEIKIELNSADSTSLVSINGIGPWSAGEIILYRKRLGGYAYKEQLLDLKAIREENYIKICKQIWIDTCKIQKIDVNFANSEILSGHPYITAPRLRKILKTRELKGGWNSIEDMIDDHTLTLEEARRLAPYLHFGQNEQ